MTAKTTPEPGDLFEDYLGTVYRVQAVGIDAEKGGGMCAWLTPLQNVGDHAVENLTSEPLLIHIEELDEMVSINGACQPRYVRVGVTS